MNNNLDQQWLENVAALARNEAVKKFKTRSAVKPAGYAVVVVVGMQTPGGDITYAVQTNLPAGAGGKDIAVELLDMAHLDLHDGCDCFGDDDDDEEEGEEEEGEEEAGA